MIVINFDLKKGSIFFLWKLMFLAVTGGVPRYFEVMDPCRKRNDATQPLAKQVFACLELNNIQKSKIKSKKFLANLRFPRN